MIKNYLKLAFKVLARRKFYTFVSLLCIAFTIGVLVFVTALLQTALYSNGAERNSNRYLIVDNLSLKRVVDGSVKMTLGLHLGYAFIDRYVLPMSTPDKIAYFTVPGEVVGYQDGQRIELTMKRTNASFWEVFAFNFIEGRSFSSVEDKQGSPVIVINEKTKRRYFGGDTGLGKKLILNGLTYEVIGVVEDVGYPEELASADVWVPVFATKASDFKQNEGGNFIAVLMGTSPSDLPAIRDEYESIMANFKPSTALVNEGSSRIKTHEEFAVRRLLRIENDDELGGYGIGSIIGMLAIGGLLFMLLPAINLININISRILERAPEIGVRRSFGAPSGSLIIQFILENLLLTFIGGVCGFALALLANYLLAASGILPVSLGKLNIDVTVAIAGIGIIVIFSILSGFYPAWKMSRLDPVKALRGAV